MNRFYTACLFFFICTYSFAQVSINHDNAPADPAAALDVQSSTQGILLPRLTTSERNVIPSPATGLLIYNTTDNALEFFDGSFWYQASTTFVSSTTGTVNPGGGLSINPENGVPADNSALLDINNSTRGILLPRTTPVQVNSPVTGLIIYNTATNRLNYFNGSAWTSVCAASTDIPGASGSQASLGVAINPSGEKPHESAILDVSSIDKGVLIPRLTNAQRDDLRAVAGLMIYNSSSNLIEYFNGAQWNGLNAAIIETPAAGIHIPGESQVIWSWTSVSGALGYKWNVTNDYNSAEDMGTGTTRTESGLICGTSYMRYVWAYNNCGRSAALVLTQSTNACFVCGAAIHDLRDGQTYPSVQIGTQCWMARNLNIGTEISTTTSQENNPVIEKYCYGDDPANCDIYGGLYQWGEMVQYLNGSDNNTLWSPAPIGFIQGICPANWHIPGDDEWSELVNYLGGDSVAGGKMKETGFLHWMNPNEGATNSSGFSAPGGGYRETTGTFYFFKSSAYYWSYTQNSAAGAWYRYLGFLTPEADRNLGYKTTALSIRCLKD